MSDRIEELIKEIAVKHGIAVGRDDPILILQTINSRLMQDSAAAQQEALESFKTELEGIAHSWGNNAKAKAERTLNAALSASKDALAQGVRDGAKAASSAVRTELDTVTDRLKAPVREAKRVAFMNFAASCLSVLAAGIVLWAAWLARH